MNIERLQTMVTMLREVEAGTWRPTRVSDGADQFHDIRAFDMGAWVIQEERWNEESQQDVSCGFSACAVGHAMLDERFGFEIASDGHADDDLFVASPVLGDLGGFDAAAAYFGITLEQSCRLFDGDRYEGLDRDVEAGDVANRIEALIAGAGSLTCT